MHIALAPFALRPGVSVETLIDASDRFDAEFVGGQDGILRRALLRDAEGGFADLVFFRDAETIDRVVEAEQRSEACAAFFSIMESDGSHRVYDVLKTYE